MEFNVEKFLSKLLVIDTYKTSTDGIKQCLELVAVELESLNFTTQWIQSEIDINQELLFARKIGLSPVEITFVCHVDTAIQNNNNFKVTELKFHGVGTCDNKGGVAIGLLALQKVINSTPFTINFLCSPNEETGSNGFHEFFKKIGKQSQIVLGLEPALVDGHLISSRSGNRWYKIIQEGISGHSGRVGIPKINPIHELLIKSQQILAAVDDLANLRANITAIESSTQHYNVIPETTQMKLDIRFENNQSLDLADLKINEIIKHHLLRCTVSGQTREASLSVVDDCPAMEQKLQYESLYNEISKLNSDLLKLDTDTFHSWGAADINHLSTPFNFTIDGLGPIGAGMHREDEYLLTESLYIKSELISKMILEIFPLYFLQEHTNLEYLSMRPKGGSDVSVIRI